MIPTIDVPATVGKADLAEVVQYRGATNATPMCLNGTEYQPFQLVLEGFKGRGGADQMYAGHYKFRLAQPADAEKDAHDLRRLPGLPSVLATTTPEVLEPVILPTTTDTPDTAEQVPVEVEPDENQKPRKRRKKDTEVE